MVNVRHRESGAQDGPLEPACTLRRFYIQDTVLVLPGGIQTEPGRRRAIQVQSRGERRVLDLERRSFPANQLRVVQRESQRWRVAPDGCPSGLIRGLRRADT